MDTVRLAQEGQRLSLGRGVPHTGHTGGSMRTRAASHVGQRNDPGRPHLTQRRGNRTSSTELRTTPGRNTEAKPRISVLVTSGAQLTAQDRLVEVNLAVSYLDVIATFRVCTHPGLVPNRRPLASEVRQRNEVAFITLLTFWEWSVLQGFPPPRPDISNQYIATRASGQTDASVLFRLQVHGA